MTHVNTTQINFSVFLTPGRTGRRMGHAEHGAR